MTGTAVASYFNFSSYISYQTTIMIGIGRTSIDGRIF